MKGEHVAIRPARESDNESLVELDRRCTMGEETTLAFDRSPDFFARSKVYETAQLFVAEADKTILGVGGVALKSLRMAGALMKAAYFYDLRVDPTFRRLGVASAIGDALRGLAKRHGADLTYSFVLEGNIPSLALVAKRGSRPVRRCALAILSAGEAAPARRWRRLEERDRERISLLFERSYAHHDFFPLSDVGTLRRLFTRIPALSLEACYGLDDGTDLSACFGLWDYSSIMRIRVQRGGAKEQAQHPWLFQAGEIAPHFLLPLAFQEPSMLTAVMREARRLLAERQRGPIVPALLVPYDPGDQAFAALGQFERFELGIQVFARPVRGALVLGDRPLYIDPVDL